MVASLNPNFSVNTSDLDRLCTMTCSDSLSEYIKNVKAACNQPGDLAGVCKGNKNLFQAPVEAAGEVLQYQYGKACAKNGSDYCYFSFLNSNAWRSANFSCNDTCTAQFYENAHNQPGSSYFFSYMDLCNQTSYWEQSIAAGWETVVQCGDAGNQTTTANSTASAGTTRILATSTVSLQAGSSSLSSSTTAPSTVESTSSTGVPPMSTGAFRKC